MKTPKSPSANIDQYIASFPEEVQQLLLEMRATIARVAPQAQEEIKYGLPTFVLSENLVHFGAFKKHIGFYPTPSAIAKFERELSQYASSKGAVQFPLAQPLPLQLIAAIVKFRVREAVERSKLKSETKSKKTK